MTDIKDFIHDSREMGDPSNPPMNDVYGVPFVQEREIVLIQDATFTFRTDTNGGTDLDITGRSTQRLPLAIAALELGRLAAEYHFTFHIINPPDQVESRKVTRH